MTDLSKIRQTETDFHDEWSRSTDLGSIGVREAFEAPTAMENKYILSQMGALAGKRLLDIGAGLGESSVYFALLGAEVTTTDISPGMVETALKLAEMHGVTMTGIVSTGEDLNVPAESFDFVYLANVIHHVHDRPKLYEQVLKALKPGGRFFSIDPVAYNPIINRYRVMATEVRTPDEEPLTRADVELARRYFPDTRRRHFWISTLLLFLKYYLVDKIHPNDVRYWKRIFSETPRTLRWWMPFYSLDRVLTRIPGLCWWSWNIVMFGTKPGNTR